MILGLQPQEQGLFHSKSLQKKYINPHFIPNQFTVISGIMECLLSLFFCETNALSLLF